MAKNRRSPNEARASALQITAAAIGSILIVSIVLYGLNDQRDETGGGQQVAAIPANPQPAPGGQRGKQQGQQQAQSQHGGNQQSSAPSQTAAEPSAPSSPSSTTGQGPNPQGGNKSAPPANAGNSSNSAPANTPQNTQPQKRSGDQ